jgi:hypothetical protein
MTEPSINYAPDGWGIRSLRTNAVYPAISEERAIQMREATMQPQHYKVVRWAGGQWVRTAKPKGGDMATASEEAARGDPGAASAS